MEVVILMGLPGSGKTTFFRERFAATHEPISKDRFPNARSRERRQERLLEAALAARRDVVIDNVNASVADRASVIAIARGHGARVVGYAFPRDPRGCVARNATRVGKGRVPEVAIFAAAKRWEPPRVDEGFDALFDVAIEDGAFVVRPRD